MCIAHRLYQIRWLICLWKTSKSNRTQVKCKDSILKTYMHAQLLIRLKEMWTEGQVSLCNLRRYLTVSTPIKMVHNAVTSYVADKIRPFCWIIVETRDSRAAKKSKKSANRCCNDAVENDVVANSSKSRSIRCHQSIQNPICQFCYLLVRPTKDQSITIHAQQFIMWL